jgi:type II secretory pathway component GspD/PulD (secretin)
MDGHTVVLGGLIDDTMKVPNAHKVPCLGDIPGFGNAVQLQSTAFENPICMSF